MDTSSVKTLIIPAAGAGTRLRPMTYATPKEMVRLVDKPISYYLLQEAFLADIQRVVFVVHESTLTTRDFWISNASETLRADFPGMTIEFVTTSERRGDGQALLAAKEMLASEAAFAITMGDLIPLPGESLIKELVGEYMKSGVPVISVEEVAREKTGQYGIIDPSSRDGRLYVVRDIVEKPDPSVAPSTIAMTGKYVLTKDIFMYLELLMRSTPAGEIKLAHALDAFANDYPLNAYACEAPHYDTGTKADLFRAEIAFTLADPTLRDAARRVLKEFN